MREVAFVMALPEEGAPVCMEELCAKVCGLRAHTRGSLLRRARASPASGTIYTPTPVDGDYELLRPREWGGDRSTGVEWVRVVVMQEYTVSSCRRSRDPAESQSGDADGLSRRAPPLDADVRTSGSNGRRLLEFADAGARRRVSDVLLETIITHLGKTKIRTNSRTERVTKPITETAETRMREEQQARARLHQRV